MKNLMVVEGCELLVSEGPPSGVASLSYAAVFRRFKARTGKTVFRARVHRYLWTSIEDFRNDTLAAFVSSVSGRDSDPIHAAVSALESGDRSSLEPVNSDLRGIIHQHTRSGPEAISPSTGVEMVRLIGTLQMVARLEGTDDSRIVEAARIQQERAEESTIESLTRTASALGVAFRYRRLAHDNMDSVRLLARLLCAIWPGTLANRHDPLETVQVNLGPGGTAQAWNILSIARLALLESVVELGDAASQTHQNHNAEPNQPGAADTGSPAQDLTGSDQLRQQLLTVARQITEERGLGHGAERVTYSRIFRRIRATTGRRIVRAQVHGRIWDSQLDYQHEVLGHIVETETSFGDQTLRSLLAGLDNELHGDVPKDPFDLLTLVAHHTFRLRHLEANNRDWLVAHCVSELHWHTNDRPAVLSQRIRRQNQRDRDRRKGRFLALSGALGLNVKAELGISQDSAAQIVAEGFYHLGLGIARREALLERDPSPSTGHASPDTTSQGTTGLVVGLVALMEFLYEPTT